MNMIGVNQSLEPHVLLGMIYTELSKQAVYGQWDASGLQEGPWKESPTSIYTAHRGRMSFRCVIFASSLVLKSFCENTMLRVASAIWWRWEINCQLTENGRDKRSKELVSCMALFSWRSKLGLHTSKQSTGLTTITLKSEPFLLWICATCIWLYFKNKQKISLIANLWERIYLLLGPFFFHWAQGLLHHSYLNFSSKIRRGNHHKTQQMHEADVCIYLHGKRHGEVCVRVIQPRVKRRATRTHWEHKSNQSLISHTSLMPREGWYGPCTFLDTEGSPAHRELDKRRESYCGLCYCYGVEILNSVWDEITPARKTCHY